ncbi:hypothetical protein PGTUg99_015925 [Puccinia graminis f. sp. tritici]|uniref:Uncharacterized protein n=1 Tax=Puccinia graminis f. sp. tritici TaxID=56615 RepID=A0A5B0M3J8_PUCGR|nr:hypothetical protein PGTUg99_015925 [Puccinia graminis f. sp. tritici]
MLNAHTLETIGHGSPSSTTSSSSSQDQMTTIKPFELPSQEYEEFDPSAVLALACAGVSMVLQQHILAWLSLFFSVTSIVNNTNRTGRPSSMSPLQGLMFSVLALTTLCRTSL